MRLVAAVAHICAVWRHHYWLRVRSINTGGAVAIGDPGVALTELRYAHEVLVAEVHVEALLMFNFRLELLDLLLVLVTLGLEVAQLATLLVDELLLLATDLL